MARHDLQADGGTILTATPTALLLEDPDFRTKVAAGSDGWEPVLEPVEPADLLTAAVRPRDLHSPAALLRADIEAVAFHGRERELGDLRAWCDSPPAALSVRVLAGPGGQGKTRLGRQLTHLLGLAGWATGHLRSDLTDYDPPPNFAALMTELPLLLVVDYAETRPRLVRRLITALSSTRHRIRVLLLARSDGEWRTDALNAARSTRDLLKQAAVTELSPLASHAHAADNPPEAEEKPVGHEAAFRRAVSDLARLLPHVASLTPYDWAALAATVQPPDDLAHSRYDNALTLQLAALTGLLQQGPAPAATVAAAPAEEIILDHEERFWADSAAAPAFELTMPTSALARSVAAAAICGAADRDEALRILSAVPALPPDQVPGVAAWLGSLYPAEPGRYWGALQPDRIAEYHASQAVTSHGLSVTDLLTHASPGQQTQLITVLARAAEAHYNADRTTDSTQVLHLVTTALESLNLDHQVLRSAASAIPQSRVTNSLALRLSTLLVHAGRQLAAQDAPSGDSALARSLSNLGIRLSDAGEWADALKVTKEAVEIYQRLAAENPAAYTPDLADALANLGARMSHTGQLRDARDVTEDAVGMWRLLAAENPAAYEPDLARSLNNLGVALSMLGLRRDALKDTRQAVAIYQRMAAENPGAYEPDLASSLNNLGTDLAATGQSSEAFTATTEAVRMWRLLAAQDPAAYEPDLANTLNNLGIRLSEAGAVEEALKATREAMKINDRLSELDPEAFKPSRARSLTNLGARLFEAEQHSEALAATQAAVQVYSQLAAANPAAYEPNLADALVNLGTQLSHASQHEEGITVTASAVDIYRRLAAANPAAYEPDLADALIKLSSQLSTAFPLTGSSPAAAKALELTERAVEIYRRMAANDPSAYDYDLASALNGLCWHLQRAQRWGDALTAGGQAAEICRRHITAEPAQFGALLEYALKMQVHLLFRLDRPNDAREIIRWLEANASALKPSQP
ncbi:hypothetical protein KAURM247S_04432 [Kitasatospora aureofaciens]